MLVIRLLQGLSGRYIVNTALNKKENDISIPAINPEKSKALAGLDNSSSPSRLIISNNRCGYSRSCSSSTTCS